MNKNHVILLIEISQKFVPEGPIHNKSALAQVIARCKTYVKLLLDLILTKMSYIIWHH